MNTLEKICLAIILIPILCVIILVFYFFYLINPFISFYLFITLICLLYLTRDSKIMPK